MGRSFTFACLALATIATVAGCSQTRDDKFRYDEQGRAHYEGFRSDVPASGPDATFNEDVRRGVGVYDTMHPQH